MWGHSKEVAVRKPGGGPSPEPDQARPWSWTFQPPELCEINVSCNQSLAVFYNSPKWLWQWSSCFLTLAFPLAYRNFRPFQIHVLWLCHPFHLLPAAIHQPPSHPCHFLTIIAPNIRRSSSHFQFFCFQHPQVWPHSQPWSNCNTSFLAPLPSTIPKSHGRHWHHTNNLW